MDFKQSKAFLDTLFSRFMSFRSDNPSGQFRPFQMPVEQFKAAPDMTREALGDAALDTVWGVLAGTPEQGSVSLFTGNTPISENRAMFLCDVLANFDPLLTWAQSYVDQRETGYSIAPLPPADDLPNDPTLWIAIGPGFIGVEHSPHAVAETPQAALERLAQKMANGWLIDEAWPDDKKVFVYDTVFAYARSHPPQPGVAVVPDDQQTLHITGHWTRPNTRNAVRAHADVPLLTEAQSPEMKAALLGVIDTLWQNRDRA